MLAVWLTLLLPPGDLGHDFSPVDRPGYLVQYPVVSTNDVFEDPRFDPVQNVLKQSGFLIRSSSHNQNPPQRLS